MNNPDINLAGIAIGNGWVDPFYQYPAYNTFAAENGLLNAPRSFILKSLYSLCQYAMLVEAPLLSSALCNLGMYPIIGNPVYPWFNLYDIREDCETPFMCYPENGLEFYLGGRKFRSMVNETAKSGWQECNTLVHLGLMGNGQYNYGYYLKGLLNSGLPVLIYNGDKDFICNWRGGEAWT